VRKYQELAEINKEYVAELRKRKAALQNMKRCFQQEAAELERQQDRGLDNAEQFTYGLDDIAQEERDIEQAVAELEDAIKREYEDVPFSTVRCTGIAGFWREVGGRL